MPLNLFEPSFDCLENTRQSDIEDQIDKGIGHNYTVKIRTRIDALKDKEKKLHEDKKVFKIAATIPGKIVAVKVEPGVRVKKGQPLVVIEAMKMENELKSPADGRVTGVHVRVGDKVENNAALLDIDTRME